MDDIAISELNQGDWSALTSYEIGHIVSNDGSSYICMANHTNHEPPNATYWALLASKGDTGPTGEGVPAGGSTGQVLIKDSGSDYDTSWATIDPDDLDDTSTTHKFTSAAEISKLAGIEAGADVTDAINVEAAGALMDSEVDADIKTLSLPASTTISVFGASLVDDTDAATARATLGLVIGTNVQAYDADLTTIAGLVATTDNFIVSVSSAWASRTPAQVRSTLDLEAGTDFYSITAADSAIASAVSTHAALTATHGVSGAIVGTSDSQTLTNKTINASNNTISNLAVSHFAGSAIVTAGEGLASSDNDTSIPTTAAVIDYVASMGGGSGTPGGSDTEVQFNDGGSFGGDAGLTYDKTTGTLGVDIIRTTGDLEISSSSDIFISADNGKLTILNSDDSAGAILDASSIATSDKTFTFPNVSGTFALLEATNSFTAANTITTANGSNAIPLTLVQNDTTNDGKALVITSAANGGTNNALDLTTANGHAARFDGGDIYIKLGASSPYVSDGGGVVIEPYEKGDGITPPTYPYARLMFNPEKASVSGSDVPDVILSAHKYHPGGSLHEHFSIYTTNSSGAALHRLDIDYLQDIADFDIQNSRVIISPTFNTSTNNFRGLQVSPTFTGSGAGEAAIEASATHSPSSSVSSAYGFINIAKGSPGSSVTITTLYAGYNRIDTGSTAGAVTTAIGSQIAAPSLGSLIPTTINGLSVANQGVSGVTTSIGIDVAAQTGSTTNIGIRVAKGDTYALQLSDTGGTAAGGITMGTDVTLYRSAADTLKTDDTLIASVAVATPLLKDSSSQTAISLTATGSANYIDVANAASTGSPVITFTGSDSSVSGQIKTKGTGGISILPGTDSTTAFRVRQAGGTALLTIDTSGKLITLGDATHLVFNTTTGTKIGTGTTQKLGFYNATPIVQPSSTTDLRTALINLGLYASGGASPLDLNGGTLTAQTIELGNASDTTIARVSAGVISVEGSTVAMLPTAQTFTALQTYQVAGVTNRMVNTTDNASVQVAKFEGDRATMAANDEAYNSYLLSDSAGNQDEFARFTWKGTTITNASEVARLNWSLYSAGSLTNTLQLTPSVLSPTTNDLVALGSSSLMWSDLFLASGAVLNINNGNWVATHTSGILTVTTGDLRVTSANVGTNADSVPTLSSTSTFTNKTLTSPTLTTPSAFTTGGTITLAENTSIALDPAGSADGKYTGITVTGTAGYTQSFGDLVYLDPTDSRWEQVDANSAAGADGDARGVIGIVVSAGTDGTSCTILLHGIIRADAKFPTFTVNNPIYASETAGSVTQTQPTTADVVIRTVGFALTADEMYFNPSSDYIIHI